MIRRTFIILPGIGVRTERSLWRHGILTWEDFIGAEKIDGISRHRKERFNTYINMAEQLLERRETRYFEKLLPPIEHWRLLEEFRRETVYLDIETDGLGANSRITVVGVHREGETRTLVRGIDLTPENLSEELENCKLLVTFNGRSFDFPLLEYNFPFSVPRVPHFDLRHGFARIGFKGGLKNIEKRIGICRPREVEYVTGEEAVYLWKLWERNGNKNALNLLKKYNGEDTRNLEYLAEYLYRHLERISIEGVESAGETRK